MARAAVAALGDILDAIAALGGLDGDKAAAHTNAVAGGLDAVTALGVLASDGAAGHTNAVATIAAVTCLAAVAVLAIG